MLQLLVSFLCNVALVLGLFCLGLLVCLWAIGKQRGAAERRVRLHRGERAAANTTAYGGKVGNGGARGVGVWRSVLRDSCGSGEPSPAVMPRRLSFSASGTPTPRGSGDSGRRTSSNSDDEGRGPFATMGVGAGALVGGTPLAAARRVTFSLTPEQQQNEYDKRASANLARRRAAAVVIAPPADPPLTVAPLVELFPPTQAPHAPARSPRTAPVLASGPTGPAAAEAAAEVATEAQKQGTAPPPRRRPASPYCPLHPRAFRSLRGGPLRSDTPFLSTNGLVPLQAQPRLPSLHTGFYRAYHHTGMYPHAHAPLVPTKRKPAGDALGTSGAAGSVGRAGVGGAAGAGGARSKRVRTADAPLSVPDRGATQDHRNDTSMGARSRSNPSHRLPPPLAIPT